MYGNTPNGNVHPTPIAVPLDVGIYSLEQNGSGASTPQTLTPRSSSFMESLLGPQSTIYQQQHQQLYQQLYQQQLYQQQLYQQQIYQQQNYSLNYKPHPQPPQNLDGYQSYPQQPQPLHGHVQTTPVKSLQSQPLQTSDSYSQSYPQQPQPLPGQIQSTPAKSLPPQPLQNASNYKSQPSQPHHTHLQSTPPKSYVSDNLTSTVTAFLNSYNEADPRTIPLHLNGSSLCLQSLSVLLTSVCKNQLLTQLPHELLASLLELLLRVIEMAGVSNIFSTDMKISDVDVQLVLKGFEATQMALTAMVQPNISRKLIRDDVLDASIKLLVRVCAAFDPSKYRIADLSNEFVLPKSFQLIIDRIVPTLDLLSYYVTREPISDRHVTPLLNACFTIFTAENATKLYGAASTLTVTLSIYGQHERRIDILDRIISSFRSHIPSSKRELRKFPLTYPISASFHSHFSPLNSATSTSATSTVTSGNSHLQLLTALTLQVLQHLALQPLESKFNKQSSYVHALGSILDSDARLIKTTKLVSHIHLCYNDIIRLVRYFIYHFVERLLPSSMGSISFQTTQTVLKNFLEDILNIVYLPEWPIAETVLYQFTIYLTQLLTKAPKIDKDKQGFSLEKLQTLCVQLLGTIGQHLCAHSVQTTKTPVIIRPHRQLNDQQASSSMPNDAEEITHCVCGTRFSGDGADGLAENQNEPMMDCDSCHVWFHIRCIGVHDSEIPNILASGWICESCIMRQEIDKQKDVQMKLFLARTHGVKIEYAENLSENLLGEEFDNDDCNQEADTSEIDENGGHRASRSVLWQLLINYLSRHATDELMHSACQYHLMMWLSNRLKSQINKQNEESSEPFDYPAITRSIENSDELQLILLNFDAQPGIRSASSSLIEAANDPKFPTQLTREAEFRISRQISWSNELLTALPQILDKLLTKCTDPQPVFRARAVAAVSNIIKVDFSLLSQENVRSTLNDRMLDESTSTREAVVDLIGSQIIMHPSILESYYPVLIDRITDVGVSVRKRVVKTLREMLTKPHLLSLPSIEERHRDMVLKLIGRMRDESTVQALVISTLQQMWFAASHPTISNRHTTRALSTLSSTEVQYQLQSRELNGTKLSSSTQSSEAASFSESFRGLVRRIVDVVSVLTTDLADDLVDIFIQIMKKDAVQGKSVSVVPSKRGNTTQAICEDICSVIVNDLISQQQPSEVLPSKVQFVIGAIQTLHLFCRISPTFVLSHTELLQPYIKLFNDKDYSAMVYQLLEMQVGLLPLLQSPSVGFLSHMENDLKSIVLTAKWPTLIRAALPCLCSLITIHVNHHNKLLIEMARKFYNILKAQSAAPSNRPNAAKPSEGDYVRCLISLGLLLKHFDVDAAFKLQSPPIQLIDTHKTFSEAAFEVYGNYMKSSSDVISQYALRGLIYLFSRQPVAITKSSAYLSNALSTEASSKVHVAALESIREFLEAEDQRLTRAQRVDTKKAILLGLNSKKGKSKSKVKTSGLDDDDNDDDANDTHLTEDDLEVVEVSDEDDDDMNDIDDDNAAINSSALELEDQHSRKKWLDSRIDVSDYVPSLVQTCEPFALQLCTSHDPVVRQEAVRFIGVYLHQLVTNPTISIPTLIALLTDKIDSVSRSALHILQLLAAKKRTMRFLEQRLAEGLRKSYLFQCLLSATFDPLHLTGADSSVAEKTNLTNPVIERLQNLYALVATNSTQRKAVISTLISEVLSIQFFFSKAVKQPTLTIIEDAIQKGTNLAQAGKDSARILQPSLRHPLSFILGQLTYLATILASLQYENDEPLHFVYHLNRIATSKGSELLCSIDELQAGETSGNDAGSTSSFDSSDLTSLCISSLAICVLLHLRNYFIEAYGLEGRFEGWNINTSVGKTPIKLSKRTDCLLSFSNFPWPDFTSDIWTIATSKELAPRNASVEALLPQFYFFRTLLEGQTVSGMKNVKATRKRSRASTSKSSQKETNSNKAKVNKRKRKRIVASSGSDESSWHEDED